MKLRRSIGPAPKSTVGNLTPLPPFQRRTSRFFVSPRRQSRVHVASQLGFSGQWVTLIMAALLTGKRTVRSAYSRDGTRLVCFTTDPRRICLVAALRQGSGAPHNPARTQGPIDPTRIHTGIAGRTSTNKRWQTEDCGRRVTDKHPKRPRYPNRLAK